MGTGKSLTGVKNGLAALTVALVFAAAFIIRCEPTETRSFATIIVYSSSFVIMMGLAWMSYRRKIRLVVLWAVLVALIVAKYFVLTGDGPFTFVLSSVALGAIYAMSTLIMGCMLFYVPLKDIRLVVFVGVMGAVLIFPLFHIQGLVDEQHLQQALFVLAPLAMLAYMVAEKEARGFMPAVAVKTRGEKPASGRWREIVFFQSKASLITLVMTIPFFFCLGIFRGYSLGLGYSIVSSDAIMLGVAVVLLILVLADRVKRNDTWFNMICFAVEGIYMAIIFFILIVPDFPMVLFGVMRAGIIVMQVWVLVLLSENAKKQALSPLYLYGVLAIVYLLPHIVGDATAVLLSNSQTYGAPVLVGGALMTIAIAAGAIIVLLVKNRSFDAMELPLSSGRSAGAPSPKEQGDSSQKAGGFARFCEDKGLSEKESEVIELYSQGRSVKSISSKLYVSESTVRTHIQRVYAKLSIHNKQELLDALDESMRSCDDVE